MYAHALFRLLLFAELLGFVVWGLGHYLFKHSFCFILFLFCFWNFIFKCIRLYPRALENILSLIFSLGVSLCVCSIDWSIFMFNDSFLCCAEFIILLYWVYLRWYILLLLNLSLWLFLISLFLPPPCPLTLSVFAPLTFTYISTSNETLYSYLKFSDSSNIWVIWMVLLNQT